MLEGDLGSSKDNSAITRGASEFGTQIGVENLGLFNDPSPIRSAQIVALAPSVLLARPFPQKQKTRRTRSRRQDPYEAGRPDKIPFLHKTRYRNSGRCVGAPCS